jgi:hypothetical protein
MLGLTPGYKEKKMSKRIGAEGSRRAKGDSLLVFALEVAIPVIAYITVSLMIW